METGRKAVQQAGGTPVSTVGLVLLCAALLCASARFTWFSRSLGPGADAFPLTEIPVAPLALGLGVALIVGGALAALAGRDAGLELASVAALAVALLIALFVGLAEALTSFVPQDTLPVTARRFLLGAGVGAGAWTALAAALAILFATTAPVRARVHDAYAVLRERGLLAVAATAAIALAVVVLVQLRQEPWLEGDVLGRTWRADGLALPWIAPLTYVGGWLLALGAVLACLGQRTLGALAAALGGWLANLAGALVLVAGSTLADLHVPGAHATPAAWAALALGLLAAGAGALLLWREARAP